MRISEWHVENRIEYVPQDIDSLDDRRDRRACKIFVEDVALYALLETHVVNPFRCQLTVQPCTMSDYSPPPSPNAFDDLEDVLYDADPAPDLADELASHALHSPLLYAAEYEPGYDLQEYYSDWEYYSDDYYDDDPTILKKNPIDGSPVKTTAGNHGPPKSGRSRKRKLEDRDSDIPPLVDDRQYLDACMKGTVWAQPIQARDNVYLAGQGEKVALLKDWRTKFGTASPKKNQRKSKAKPALPKDESWANDLSLADMGLLNARGAIAQVQEDDGEGVADIDEEAEEDYDEHDEMGEDDAMEDELMEGQDRTSQNEKPAYKHVHSQQTSPQPDSFEFDVHPVKRRMKDAAPSAPSMPSPPATNGSALPNGTRRTQATVDSASTTASVAMSKSKKKQQAPAVPEGKRSLKRRALSEDEDTDASALPQARATAPTASSRAKRVASTANNVLSEKNKASAESGPARATRSRKK